MAKARKEKGGRIVLVGTYRGDQLTKWRGWYCYPVGNGEECKVESGKCRVESVKCGERGIWNGESSSAKAAADKRGAGNGVAPANFSTFQPFNLSTFQPSTVTYPLSIFPESEQRRIAADFGQPRIPEKVKRAIAGAEKAMARSRKRAEKGLCTKDESDDFCAKSAAALRRYLDKQVESGTITPAERKALGW